MRFVTTTYLLLTIFMAPMSFAANMNSQFTDTSTANDHRNVKSQRVLPSSKTPSIEQQAKTAEPLQSGDEIWLYQAKVTLSEDNDSDGYFHQISLMLDIDTHRHELPVYFTVILENSSGEYSHLYNSDVFWLHNESAEDAYELESTLLEDWHSDNYSIHIEVFHADNHQRLALFSAETIPSFNNLYLESRDFEVQPNDVFIYSVNSQLMRDIDGDGHHHKFSLILDADTHSPDSHVYAEVIAREEDENWQSILTTAPFTIERFNTDDEQRWEFTWHSGYSFGYYDIEIQLYDAHSHSLMTVISYDESQALHALPLESRDTDVTHHSSTTVTHHSSGGGSLGSGIFFAFLLLLTTVKRIHQGNTPMR